MSCNLEKNKNILKVILFLVIFLILDLTLYAAPSALFFKKNIKTSHKKKYIKYRVKKEDYLYKILRKINIPYEYFPVFIKEIKRINSHIKNVNQIYAGQVLKIPVIVDNEDYITECPDHKSLKDIDITLLLLKKLGFKPYKSDLIYPCKDGKWLLIDGEKNPIIVSPDGKKIVITKEDKFRQIYDNNLNIYFCHVVNISPYSVLKEIEKIEKDIKVWEKGSNLIIDLEDFVLEVNADVVVIKQDDDKTKKYYLFYLTSQKDNYKDKLIEYFLINYDIYIYNLSKDKKEFLLPDHVASHIYIPSVYNNLESQVLNNLSKQKLKIINLTFKNDCHLYIRVHKIIHSNNEIYLVDKKKSILVPILRVYGYEAFTY